MNLEKQNEYDLLFNSIKKKEKEEKKEDIKKYNECNKCNSCDLIDKYGYFICNNCGNKCYNSITSTQEWRYYGINDNKSSDPSRCSTNNNELMPEISGNSILASYGHNNSKKMKLIKQIHTWNSINYRQNTMITDFTLMDNIAVNHSINRYILDEAKFIFKRITDLNYKKKSKKEAIIAACIQCACKIKNAPRGTKEIANMFNITKQEMRKGAKQFEELWSVLNEKIDNSNLYEEKQPNNSIDYLNRRCVELNLSEDVIKICRELCDYVENEELLIKHIPLSRTAGCIYFVCCYLNININKNDITKICSISEVTINKCYNKLLKIKDDIIENTSLKDYCINSV